MQRDDLAKELARLLPVNLAEDLTDNFVQIRLDVVTNSLGGSEAGKFVETFVQVLQQLDAGAYDPAPNVDEFLRKFESQASDVPDGLRICGSRIARSMYSLRSKRNVVHKVEIDSNSYDLHFLHHGAQWLMAELLRIASGSKMQEAGALVEMVQAPAGGLVEDFGGKKLVTRNLSSREEVLVLLHDAYPGKATLAQLTKSMDRFKAVTVRGSTRTLWQEKSVEGTAKDGFVLTGKGFNEAVELIKEHI